MNTIEFHEVSHFEIRIYEKVFNVNDQLYDLVLKKSDEIFSILVKDTAGKMLFHEQEIAEQLGFAKPGLDQLLEFINTLYSTGLNIKRTRDFQIKLLVEGCPSLFPVKSKVTA